MSEIFVAWIGHLKHTLALWWFPPCYPYACNSQTWFSKSYQSINVFTGTPVVLVSVNKLFLSVIWGSWLYLLRSFRVCAVSLGFFVTVIDVLCQLLDTYIISSGFFYAYFVCCAGCLALVTFLQTYWSLCYNHIARKAILVPLDKL